MTTEVVQDNPFMFLHASDRGIALRKLVLFGIFFYLLMISNLAASYGQSLFTGSFLADSRPHKIMHLVLTQTKDSVSGSLIIVMPNGRGSTKSNTLILRGTTDGNAITLISTKFLEDSVINGRKQREKIMLMFPTDSGSISNVTFLPATGDYYNLLLKQWQEELAAIHKQQQEELNAIQSEKQKLTKLAETLSDAINTAKSTRIKQNLDDLKSALEDEQFALQDLEDDFAELRGNASLRPMTCYQANSVVDYDYNSRMAHSYDSRLGYAHNEFMNQFEELEKRLLNVEPLATKIKQAAHALDQAIKDRKFSLPNLSVMPGDEKQVLEQYQVLATSASNDLLSLKAAHSGILSKAKEIMREGEKTLAKTQALVRCD
ncbi:MAG: hypothetical protein KBA82_12470 [Nitrosomonas sp.]|nr:hypothetical protein [Nitrosomonas sp.]MBP7113744.1 hypothetical protein [Nitrosomonas sp.]